MEQNEFKPIDPAKLVTKIAGRLSGKHEGDLTTAERQIVKLLTDAGHLTKDDSGNVIDNDAMPRLATFIYPNFGTPDGFPEHTAHSGQVVKVIRQLTDEECDEECQPMYLIRALDGWEGHVDGSELEFQNLTRSLDHLIYDGMAQIMEDGSQRGSVRPTQ